MGSREREAKEQVMPKLIQRPHGGLNTETNRYEYLMAHTFQRVLESAVHSINLHDSDNMREAMSDFNSRVKLLTGPSFWKIINTYQFQIAHLGQQSADKKLIRGGVKLHELGAEAKIPIRPQTIEPIPNRVRKTITQVGPRVKTSAIPNDFIDRMTDFSIDHFDRITDDLKDRLTTTLKEGYSNQESYQGMTTRIQEALNVDANRAKERARTLTMETHNQAQILRYQQAEVPGLEWLTVEDEVTCDICGDLDGTVFEIDDPDLIRPPCHNFCRCDIIPYVKTLPPDVGEISDDTRAFCENWREKYFNIPLYDEN